MMVAPVAIAAWRLGQHKVPPAVPLLCTLEGLVPVCQCRACTRCKPVSVALDVYCASQLAKLRNRFASAMPPTPALVPQLFPS
jgi:hypothetical protein